MIVEEGVGYGKSEMLRIYCRENKEKENRWEQSRRDIGRNFDAPSLNQCYSGKGTSVTHSECVFVVLVI